MSTNDETSDVDGDSAGLAPINLDIDNGVVSRHAQLKSASNSFLTDGEKLFDENEIVIEPESKKPLLYRIAQNPPFHLLVMFALQQCLLAIANPLSVTVILSEITCSQKDEVVKAEVLCASLFMVGVSTIVMTTFGIRLPIFQGPSSSYLIPLLAMASMPEFKCPELFEDINPKDNTTTLMAVVDNNTLITSRELAIRKITQLSGSLMLAGSIHFIIGVTGLVGVLIRYIGPVTIVPTIVLVGLFIYRMIVKFCETSWIIAVITCASNFILSLYLSNKKTPLPMWSRSRGFHVLWFPLHQSFSVLLSILFSWAVSFIMTVAGAITDDPKSHQYLARTDARTYFIDESAWFIFPYPGKLGSLSFSTAGFVSFMMATILSVLDSIGDYNACARVTRVPPPPRYAFNRGIAVEGLMSLLSGALGCCHATVSYGPNIGAMNITRVVSRSVFQVCGLIFIFFAVCGKIGAVFLTIPYAVLGGNNFVLVGIFIGVVLSNLQTVDLNSTRNLTIIGTALLIGLMMPYWVQRNPNALDTGNPGLNSVLQVLLSNPSFVGGVYACFLDNTIPGTLKERGLAHMMKELDDEEAKEMARAYDDGLEIYNFPFLPKSFSKSRMAKYVPIFEFANK